MAFEEKHSLSTLYFTAIKKVGIDEKRGPRSKFIIDIMLKEDLIEFVEQEGQTIFYKLTTHGTLIKGSGGWLNHVNKAKRKKVIFEYVVPLSTLTLTALGLLLTYKQSGCTTKTEATPKSSYEYSDSSASKNPNDQTGQSNPNHSQDTMPTNTKNQKQDTIPKSKPSDKDSIPK